VKPHPPRSLPNLLLGFAALCLFLVSLGACSTTHTARPLGKGKHAALVSVGGPIVSIGSDTKVPMPLTTLTYKTGLTDRADFFVGWHILETFLNEGNFFFDIGASYYFLDQRGPLPGVSAAFTISPLLSRKAGWASMDFQITASWALGPQERHLIYVGFHNFVTPVRPQLIPTAPYTFSPYLGAQLRLGPNKEIGLSGEVKWLRPYQDTSESVVSYLGPGNRGALSFVGAITIFAGKGAKKSRDQGLEEREAPEESTEEPAEEPAEKGATP